MLKIISYSLYDNFFIYFVNYKSEFCFELRVKYSKRELSRKWSFCRKSDNDSNSEIDHALNLVESFNYQLLLWITLENLILNFVPISTNQC